MTDLYDELNITNQDEILTDAELEAAEPVAEDEIEETGAPEEPIADAIDDVEAQADEDPGTEPEDAGDGETQTEEDALAAVIESITGSLASLVSRLDSIQARLDDIEAKEIARSKKLYGFFAPVGTDRPDVSTGELPRIEKKYI